MIMMAVWRNIGTLMVLFLAGLRAVPRNCWRLHVVDGAGPCSASSDHTSSVEAHPLLGAVLISVGYLQFFEEPFVMTKGGPLDSDLSISFYVYNQFGFGNYASRLRRRATCCSSPSHF